MDNRSVSVHLTSMTDEHSDASAGLFKCQCEPAANSRTFRHLPHSFTATDSRGWSSRVGHPAPTTQASGSLSSGAPVRAAGQLQPGPGWRGPSEQPEPATGPTPLQERWEQSRDKVNRASYFCLPTPSRSPSAPFPHSFVFVLHSSPGSVLLRSPVTHAVPQSHHLAFPRLLPTSLVSPMPPSLPPSLPPDLALLLAWLNPCSRVMLTPLELENCWAGWSYENAGEQTVTIKWKQSSLSPSFIDFTL